MTGVAFAADPVAGAAAGGGLGAFGQFIPLILIFVVFYFCLSGRSRNRQNSTRRF